MRSVRHRDIFNEKCLTQGDFNEKCLAQGDFNVKCQTQGYFNENCQTEGIDPPCREHVVLRPQGRPGGWPPGKAGWSGGRCVAGR